VRPEDITLNIGKGVPIPKPNMPGKWKNVIHDQTVTWLANWTENINGNHKYVFLAAGSSLKGQSDMMKFEKARELKVSLICSSYPTLLTAAHRITLTAFAKITMRT
jgi:DNA topoisomerase-1